MWKSPILNLSMGNATNFTRTMRKLWSSGVALPILAERKTQNYTIITSSFSIKVDVKNLEGSMQRKWRKLVEHEGKVYMLCCSKK